jgi:hypothetical protein
MGSSLTSSQLTTPAKTINRTKYFPIELYCVNMIPNTTYDAYANGQLINAFCKPYGGNLGSPLTSNASGKLTIQYHASVQYKQQYIINPSVGNNSLVQSSIVINLVDPFNNSSVVKIPLLLKSGSSS